METFVDQIASNKRKTALLVLVSITLLVLVGGCIGYVLSDGAPEVAMFGAILGCVFASGGAIFSYFRGDAVLMSIASARQVSREEDLELFNVVEEMAIAAGVPVPRIFLINDTALNAFATGRDPQHAAVAITSGLREKLNREQLQAVIAHEMGHVVNYDIRLTMLIAVMSGVIVLMCDFFWRSLRFSGRGSRRRDSDREGGGGAMVVVLVVAVLLAIVAPILSRLLQLAVSREREFLADATAVRLCRNPVALAGALKLLVSDTEKLEAANRATEHLYIVNPTMKLARANLDSIWATHPPIDKRIERIMSLTV